MRKTAPVVAIVGRPNVGKSAVFNRLAGKRISIVHDRPGVTRDRIMAPAGTVDTALTLMDTGGIGETLEDGLHAQVALEADIAMEDADLILFVVDGRSGLTPVDHVVADRLRQKGMSIWLAVNKVDGPEHEGAAGECFKLGFDQQFFTSATTGHGFDPLRAALVDFFPTADDAEDEPASEEMRPKIALIGRPNVGKSSLVNAILKDQRSMVSAVAGTTRDSIDVPFELKGRPYLLIDTAGMRRRTHVNDIVEAFSVSKAQDSVRRADVVALVVDAGAGATMQERKIAQFMLEEHKPCVIVYNKFDLYHPDGNLRDRLDELQEYNRNEFFFLPYAPVVACSAKEGKHLEKIFTAVEKIRDSTESYPGTGLLNRYLQQAIERTLPPAIKGKRLKLYYATISRQSRDDKRPMAAPVIVLFINYKELLSETYLRYLENTIREEFPFEGLPLRFDIRERRRDKWTEKSPTSNKFGGKVHPAERAAKKAALKAEAADTPEGKAKKAAGAKVVARKAATKKAAAKKALSASPALKIAAKAGPQKAAAKKSAKKPIRPQRKPAAPKRGAARAARNSPTKTRRAR